MDKLSNCPLGMHARTSGLYKHAKLHSDGQTDNVLALQLAARGRMVTAPAAQPLIGHCTAW